MVDWSTIWFHWSTDAADSIGSSTRNSRARTAAVGLCAICGRGCELCATMKNEKNCFPSGTSSIQHTTRSTVLLQSMTYDTSTYQSPYSSKIHSRFLMVSLQYTYVVLGSTVEPRVAFPRGQPSVEKIFDEIRIQSSNDEHVLKKNKILRSHALYLHVHHSSSANGDSNVQ